MDLVIAWLRYFGSVEVPREVLVDNETEFIEKVHKPLGVVAAIALWNAPLMLATWKVAPALRAGNTVVLKPSPYTPLSTLAMGELLRSVFPAGVLNVVSGLDPLGARMVEHPVPRKVSFTGSTATGKKVAASAANSLKRVTLELGGNDPAIVLPDADPAAIADKLFWGGFVNSGQICLAVKRVYVHSTIHDSLVEELAQRARAAVVGDGFDPRTTLGPLTNAMQRDKVAQLVSAAIDDGAVAVTGGEALPGQGYFYPPTILANAKDGMAVVDEEQFGPVMPIVAYDDLDAVVERVNASPFGLTASVWSTDLDAAARVAAQLDAGQVTINAHANGLRLYRQRPQGQRHRRRERPGGPRGVHQHDRPDPPEAHQLTGLPPTPPALLRPRPVVRPAREPTRALVARGVVARRSGPRAPSVQNRPCRPCTPHKRPGAHRDHKRPVHERAAHDQPSCRGRGCA